MCAPVRDTQTRMFIKYFTQWVGKVLDVVMILPQVHLRKPCYDFYFL